MTFKLLQTTAALSLGLFALQPLAAAAQTTTEDCIPSASVTCPPGASSVPGAESPDGTDDSTAAAPVDPTSTGGGASGSTSTTPMVPGAEAPDGTDDSTAAAPVDPSSTGGGLTTEGMAPSVPGTESPDGTDDSTGAVPQ
ncbi:hypothetical protein [Cereibacter johrii]|uniref:hypothetical protein n=1 Tax=Cereibacter johrii TaxID=445629 RepID=UPI000DCEA1D3|nr:hypothetical protein [Cereibacter johrii]RAZ82010.1 hypothetical protein DDV93_20365 [Cereibacter johrii]